jgi:GNAT superfamily N-acetyltransferase
MSDQWMPNLTLPLSFEQYRQLPRNPAYRYEYLNGTAYLTPRARHYHALLELQPQNGPAATNLRPATVADLSELERVFAIAFERLQPFGSLEDDTRREAARHCLERTRNGGDGPWIEQASFVAVDSGKLIGAILITLLPEGDLSDWDSFYWTAPPATDAIERRLGRPHLTWIFVAPLRSGQGIGTALLSASVNTLCTLGFTELVSTFLLGNESSMLWHWRNGFRLLTYPASFRRPRPRRQDGGHA